MFIQTESKAQGWRAMAAFDDGVEALIFVGRSSTHVREGYGEAYLEQFEDDERDASPPSTSSSGRARRTPAAG